MPKSKHIIDKPLKPAAEAVAKAKTKKREEEQKMHQVVKWYELQETNIWIFKYRCNIPGRRQTNSGRCVQDRHGAPATRQNETPVESEKTPHKSVNPPILDKCLPYFDSWIRGVNADARSLQTTERSKQQDAQHN